MGQDVHMIRKVELDFETRSEAQLTGPKGVDTVVLLGRSTPLPESVDLSKLFEQIPAANPEEWSWVLQFENGELKANDFANDRTPGRSRGPAYVPDEIRSRDDMLYERLRTHFPLVRTLHFPNSGEEQESPDID